MKHSVIRYILALALLLGVLRSAPAQNTTFTYQGRVLDNGTSFTGVGQFKFAMVTSTNANQTAAATANISGTFVTTYTVPFGGNGYVSPPAVTIFGGGGSGATAHATISGGIVTAVTADNPGSGYTSAPGVLLAPPPPNITYTTYWSNDGTSSEGSQPAAAVSVTVTGGLFTVVLGNNTVPNMAVIDAALFLQPNLQLRIWFNDGVNGFAALDPAQNLTTAPYAVVAEKLAGGFTVQNNTNGAPNVIGGAAANFVSPGVIGATIGGGGAIYYNRFWPDPGTNSVSSDFGTIAGGYGNSIKTNSIYSAVGGGYENLVFDNSFYCTIGGGGGNNIFPITSGAISGATVGGGSDNSVRGDYATVPGGFYNIAAGKFSFTAGTRARAQHDGSFVWADSTGWPVGPDFTSTAPNQFLIRAAGGVGIGTASPSNPLSVSGNADFSNVGIGIATPGTKLTIAHEATYSFPNPGQSAKGAINIRATTSNRDTGITFSGPGADNAQAGIYVHQDNAAGTTMHLATTDNYANGPQVRMTLLNNGNVGIGTTTPSQKFHVIGNIAASGTVTANGVLLTSDRNAKENLTPLDSQAILAKVAALPITEWNYKNDERDVHHIGPMAQDFQAAFGLNGMDDKHISVVDEGGVALAAIQGLNQILKETRAENAALKCRLEKLETLLQKTNQQTK